MSLRNIFNRILGREAPPTLRNRPDSMAWVRVAQYSKFRMVGIGAIHMRPVKLGQFKDGVWPIHPMQDISILVDCTIQDRDLHAGQVVWITGLADELLEPWRDIGDDEKDESTAWLPAAPKATPAVREMRSPAAPTVQETPL